MDQAELARLVSRNRVTISDVERGKLQPGKELAKGIAAVLGVEPRSLYETPSQGLWGGQVRLTLQELQVIDAMRRLGQGAPGDIQRAKIWAFAQGLAASGSAEGAASAAELAEAMERASRDERTQAEPRTGSQ